MGGRPPLRVSGCLVRLGAQHYLIFLRCCTQATPIGGIFPLLSSRKAAAPSAVTPERCLTQTKESAHGSG